MKKERLEELREKVTRHRSFIDDHAMNTSTEDDVLELIDAELARQSANDGTMASIIAHGTKYQVLTCSNCGAILSEVRFFDGKGQED